MSGRLISVWYKFDLNHISKTLLPIRAQEGHKVLTKRRKKLDRTEHTETLLVVVMMVLS